MNGALTWSDAFTLSLQNLWISVVAVLPKIILAVLLFAVGWLIAGLVKQGLREIFKMLKVDRALSQTGLEEALTRAGFELESGLFVGEIAKWFIVILFLQLSLQLVGLDQVNTLLSGFAAYLPNVIIAGIVIMAGAIVANFVGRLVAGSARATIGHGHMAGTIAKWAIWIFVAFAAITQLQVLNAVIQPIIYGVIAMLALAGGLAFGLGGRDVAAKTLERWSRKNHE